MASARLPEVPAPEHESFMVRSHPEIGAILRALAQAGTLVTAYVGGARDFFASTVLAMDPQAGEFLLEAGPGTALPSGGDALTVVAFLDHVKVQFDSVALGAVGYEGHRALRARNPSRLLRLQRRENFRVETPTLRAPVCHVPAGEGRPAAELRVADVSCGGIALAIGNGEIRLVPGDVVRGCVLELPGMAPLGVTIEARHAAGSGNGEDSGMRTCGCRFVDLPGPAATLLQRYVNSVERERLRLRD